MYIYHFDDHKKWLEWRRNGIGGSDISVIMGSNKYKTELSLWEEKCGYASPSYMNDAMIHGIQYESVARDWVNECQSLQMKPVCVQDEEIDYFRASLDGWDPKEKIVCEIKCPLSVQTIENARNKGIIPDHWMHQIQWNMSLVNPEKSLFIVWDHTNDEGIVINIEPDLSLQKQMREKAHKFWELVKSGTCPDLNDDDFIELNDPELQIYLDLYRSLSQEIKRLEDEKKSIKDKIVEFGDDGNFKAFGYCIRRMPSRRSYDIDLMKRDGIDVDKYIKKSNEIGYYVIVSPRDRK